VSVTSFEGVIDMTAGMVTVVQIPSTREGGSRAVDTEELDETCMDVDLIVAAGVEAVVSLREIDREPAVTVAAGDVAAAAAAVGQRVVVVASTDTVGRVTDAIRDGNVSYEVTNPVA
jgi:putative transcriptional regulator